MEGELEGVRQDRGNGNLLLVPVEGCEEDNSENTRYSVLSKEVDFWLSSTSSTSESV